MASIAYNTGTAECLDGTIGLLTSTIKVMLVSTATAYTPNRDNDVVDAGGANDPVDAETNVSGYTRGYGGAGRKTLANKTIVTDKTNDRAEFDNTVDLTWTALGAGETLEAAIVIKEGAVNDTTSRLIVYLDFTNTPTNGSDITLQFDAEGLIQWSTV